MRLARRGFRHNDERDLPRLEAFHPLLARQNAAIRREDARNADEIARGDAGGSERQLERRQLLTVLADAFGKEHLLGNESEHVTLLVARGDTNGKQKVRDVQEVREG
jgi:hypothetical protein